MADPTPYPDTGEDTGAGRDGTSATGMPRWVKAFLIIAIVLVLLGVVALLTGRGGPGGGHGPGRHIPSGLGGQAPTSSITEAVQR